MGYCCACCKENLEKARIDAAAIKSTEKAPLIHVNVEST